MNNMFDKVDELRKNNWKEIIVTENDRPVCKNLKTLKFEFLIESHCWTT